MAEMLVVAQDGLMLTVDEVPDEVKRGMLLYHPDTGAVVEIVYIDRESNEIGIQHVGRVADEDPED